MALYSVSEVTAHLRGVLEREPILRDLWVSGEIGNLTRPASGHSYFTLRDSRASMRAVMFRDSIGAHLLADGAAVVAHGRVTIYEVRGELQLVADVVQLQGVGALEREFQELKARLEKEGLFDRSRKRPLPRFPRRVAVVTSPTGAVWRDIQTVVSRRYPLTELVLAPAVVQGDAAPFSVVDALEAISGLDDVDAIIIARGGGSLEDLAPFNREMVARAIYAARSPVVSAVGHETDTTLADLVADHRAATPSAAAEMTVPDVQEIIGGIVGYRHSLGAAIDRLAGRRSENLANAEARLHRATPDLDSLKIRIDDLLTAAGRRLRQSIESSSERLDGLAGRLDALSPRHTLRRGYAIVQIAGRPGALTESSQVQSGETIDVTLADGRLEAEVLTTTDRGEPVESGERPSPTAASGGTP